MWEPLARPWPAGLLEQVFLRAPIYDLVFCHLSPRTLVWLSRTCRAAHLAVTCFFRRAYNINRHLSRYFSDPLAFRSIQARTGLVISGSNALQFLDRTLYPESDIDLYAHPGHVYELLGWLESVGYQFQPNEWHNQEHDWRDHAKANWDGTSKRIIEDTANGLGTRYPGIAAVYTFKRFVVMDRETVELQVQVIETTCNPIETIMKFHTSLSKLSSFLRTCFDAFGCSLRDERYYFQCSIFLLPRCNIRGAMRTQDPRSVPPLRCRP